MPSVWGTRHFIEGLRTSDSTSLFVLTQDLLRQHLGRIAPETLADLFALSELAEQVPRPILRDLQAFILQKEREIRDLPDGDPLIGFLAEMNELPVPKVPTCLRELIGRLGDHPLSPATQECLDALVTHLQTAPPEVFRLREKPVRTIQRSEAPERLQTPSQREENARTAPAGSPRARAPRAPAPQRDERRAEWMREDLLARLVEYAERGLKETVLVGGCRHRSPFDDMTDLEILAELKHLKNVGLVVYSAGRWSMKARPRR